MSHTQSRHEAGVRKRRLLVMASTYPRWKADSEPGFVHELSRRLCRDFDVAVLCPHATGAKTEEVLDGVRIFRYRYAPEPLETLVNGGGIVSNLKSASWKFCLLPSFVLAQVVALRKLLRSWEPDVIHAHWLIPQGLAIAILSGNSNHTPPFLVTSHGADLFALNGKIFQFIKRFVIEKSASVSVVSNVMKLEVERLGSSGRPVQVLPMGVDLQNVFTPVSSVARSDSEILFVGRLVEKKGLKFLVDAMPEILRRHSKATLTIVGFGPEEHALKRQVEDLRLGSRVNFVGPVQQKELAKYYQRAAVFVAPFVMASTGDQEGLGLVLVEALGSGCPSVVSDMPAVRDVTAGLEGVKMVSPGDPNALASAVSQTLENHSFARESAERSSVLIRSRFDWEIVAKRYSNTLKNIIDRQETDDE